MGADREQKKQPGMVANRPQEHGAYRGLYAAKRLDGRTKLAKAIRQLEGELSASLGGEPSVQERLLIGRAAAKAARCWLLERQFLRKPASQRALDDYLRWSRELRSDLVALGLEQRARRVVDLGDYLEERYGS